MATANHVEGNETTPVASDGCDPPGAETGPVGELNQSPAQETVKPVPPHVSLTPPEDCIAVTADRGVLKKVLQAGETDDKPSMHARCLVHYVGYLAGNGEVFMDTRSERETEEPAVVVAGRTAAVQETGLCLAAATMSRGERALVYIQDPVYGYGAVGSFSFPCVPPHSQLVYEMEMVSWEGTEETDNDRDRGSLLFEERLERSERRMDFGNQLFKGGSYKEALAKYAMALSYLDEDFMYQLEGHYLDKAEAVKLRVHLNMAATQLKTGDYNTAIYNCGQVLNIDPQNVKALYRRGKARHALGRTEEAQQDLEAAIKIAPSDRAIVAEMHELKNTMKKEKQAQAALFQGRLPPSKTVPAAAAAAATVAAGTAAAGPGGEAARTPGHQYHQQQPLPVGSSNPKAANGSGGGTQQQQQLTKRAVRGGKAPPGGGGDGGGSGAGVVGEHPHGRKSPAGVLVRLLAAGLTWLWALILAVVGTARTNVKRRRPVAPRAGPP